jgi:hypothetical protein
MNGAIELREVLGSLTICGQLSWTALGGIHPELSRHASSQSRHRKSYAGRRSLQP